MVSRLYAVFSGATSRTGSVMWRKFEEKLTSETAEVTISAAPPATASHSTGRHRGEGGRPSGNSSRVRKNR